MLQKGDIIINELAAGFNGYSAQIGVPICVGEPTPKVRKMFDEVVLPVFNRMAAKIAPGNTLYEVWEESKFIREMGYQSRPGHLHGIDWVSHPPGIGAAGPHWEEDIDLVINLVWFTCWSPIPLRWMVYWGSSLDILCWSHRMATAVSQTGFRCS